MVSNLIISNLIINDLIINNLIKHEVDMKRLTRGLSMLVAMMLLLGCVGCGNSTTAYDRNSKKADASANAEIKESADSTTAEKASSDASEKDTSGLKIAYSCIASEESAPWVGALWNELESVCEENNWEFIALSAEGSSSKQEDQVGDLISQEPDYFVLMAGDATMADEWVKRIHNAGIPVIMVSTDATVSAYNEVSAYVGEDQEALSSQLVMDMIEKNGASAGLNVVAITGYSVQQDYILREQGVEKTLPYFSNYRLLATEQAGNSREKAKRVMEDYLDFYDDIDAVLAYDCEFALGALDAIKEAGLEGQIQIYTITASAETLEAMEEGYITECALNSPVEMAKGVGETIIGLEKGQIPDHYKYTEREYITKDNLSDYSDRAVY